MNTKEIGQAAEELAVSYLEQQGYQILEQNWTSGKLEIDIIAFQDKQIIVVEVKKRNSLDFIRPEEAVTHAKQKNLIRAINHYVDLKKMEYEIRFDIIAVQPNNKIVHITDAFYPRVNSR